MKKILLVAVVGMFSLTAMAQKGGSTNFSAGIELGIPMGDMKESQSMGFGGSVKALFGEASGFTASAGYMTFAGKDVSGIGTYPAFSAIPVKVGYRLATEGGFYFEPQVGMSFTSQGGSSASAFTYAPNVGIITGGLDLSARYEAMSNNGSTISFVGFRLAYSFGSK